ncbi:hypothetical protein NPX13_g6149 [Xylaria arbuscula]|uniref:Uncharacterized protein n=1 Tax=Xylaria arbuscula TaxID=114810 RepID=A0A9W8TMF2_9PEZI|nr:hypothetical protein NPX13_g6149 [Xylaria arbuscula]
MSATNPPNQALYDFSLGSDSPGPRQDGFVDRFDVIFPKAFLLSLTTFVASNGTWPFPRTISLETQGCQTNETTSCAKSCSIMADFQETQAILVATVQVSTLVYFNANTLVGTVDTFGGVIANLDVIQQLAFDGMMPVLLGQDQFKDNAPIEACGGNPSPAAYCFARASGSNNLFGDSVSSHGFLSESPLSWTRYWAIAFILIDQLLAWLPTTVVGKHLSFSGLKSTSWLVHLFWYFAWLILQLLLFISVFSYVTMLYDVFLIYAGGLNLWSFGQFIAVMVWVPLGAKLCTPSCLE